jgi:hypothetical protein
MPTKAQLDSLQRFIRKLPANAKRTIVLHSLPNNGLAARALSPGRVPGSHAIYEKQMDSSGSTIQYTKTTYDNFGTMISVKDKITGNIIK